MQQGQPMIIMGDDAQRVQDKDAQEYNISAARGVAESVRSTLGPKGMDKMLVNSMGDVTITNDGVTILQEMDIDNPTAEMVVEVAETQEDEAGDGTTSAVAIAGELLKNAEDLLEQDIHPTAVIKGFNLASEYAREQVDEVATAVDPDDTETLQNVAETSMTGKGAELDKDVLADLVVRAVQGVTVEADDGSHVVDLANLNIETRTGRAAGESRLLTGAAIDKDPVHDDMPTDFESANVLLLNDPIEVEEADVDTSVNVDSPDQLQKFLDQEEEQLREKVDQIVDSGADVVFCQKGIDDLAQHYLAKEGVLAVRRTKKSDLTFLKNVLGAPIVTDLDSLTADDLAVGSVERDGDEELFYVEGEDAHGVTLLLYGTTDHVVDELERGIQDALDVVSTTVSDGRTLPGGGAVEVEIARRLRDYADSVEGREQLAVEAFADSLELIPRVLAENAGLDAIDLLVDLRAAHEAGDQHAGLDVFAGEVVDTAEAGVVETAHAKEQAIASAAEAANLVLKIDDIISAGDLSTAGGDDEGGAPGGGMGGMGGMGGAM
ncbi:thermosome subunit beta [Halorubrum ezzemoulense]|nr:MULTISPECIES: thermosome subunit beta [Halorubrum]MDB2223957.1 thermosome subunit beta [Halorubrum ezzemoulense]MDB2241383.1 thermosome subunit beta [Halorubrum ezzemoulense]MDB2245085.1 thermosome subunit beta [Halorubrum ezzemoulense]MDB2252571.1 thermosome subunit beta [Halorubrum ezzemoulense]MDB2259390.1 thermosome subunit beta [Halorubrum ezzemoulense]